MEANLVMMPTSARHFQEPRVFPVCPNPNDSWLFVGLTSRFPSMTEGLGLGVSLSLKWGGFPKDSGYRVALLM